MKIIRHISSPEYTVNMAIGLQETFQLSSKAMLDKIDKLRELGVSEYVALPQVSTCIFGPISADL